MALDEQTTRDGQDAADLVRVEATASLDWTSARTVLDPERRRSVVHVPLRPTAVRRLEGGS